MRLEISKNKQMEFLKQPKVMSMEGDLAENWKKFKQNYHIYCKTSACHNKTKEIQAAILLHWVRSPDLNR